MTTPRKQRTVHRPPAHPVKSVTREVPTTPDTVALLEQLDQELASVQQRAVSVIQGILASHAIKGNARILNTAGTRAKPVLVIELLPAPAAAVPS